MSLLYPLCCFLFFFFFLMLQRPPSSSRTYTFFPQTTLFRSPMARGFSRGFCRSSGRPVNMKWSNGMDRNQKAEVVSALNAHLAEVGVVVVTRNLGLTEIGRAPV